MKTCVVCNKKYYTQNQHKKTCSPECEHILRSQNMQKRWKDKAKNFCSVCGRKFLRNGNKKTCSAMCAAVLKKRNAVISEKMIEGRNSIQEKAKTEEYHNAKEWSLISPDGETFNFKNLAFFLEKNKELFTPDELDCRGRKYPLAFYMLGKLRPSRKAHLQSWHGWQWNYDSVPITEWRIQ